MTTIPPIELTTKTSPLIAPRACDALSEQKQEARRADQCAIAHAELPVVEVTEQGAQPVGVEAPDADGEALNNQPAKAQSPGEDQKSAECRMGFGFAKCKQRQHKRNDQRRKP